MTQSGQANSTARLAVLHRRAWSLSVRAEHIEPLRLLNNDSALMELNLNPERYSRLRLGLVSLFGAMTPHEPIQERELHDNNKYS